MRVGAAVAVLLCVAALAVPSASAQACQFPCLSLLWPLDFQAHYNATSETVTLMWQPPDGFEHSDVEEYVVYRDGVEVDRRTVNWWSESLALWQDEYHAYQISAVIDGDEGAQSLPAHVVKYDIPNPLPNCSFLTVVVTFSPPGLWPRVHQQCLPP